MCVPTPPSWFSLVIFILPLILVCSFRGSVKDTLSFPLNCVIYNAFVPPKVFQVMYTYYRIVYVRTLLAADNSRKPN